MSLRSPRSVRADALVRAALAAEWPLPASTGMTRAADARASTRADAERPHVTARASRCVPARTENPQNCAAQCAAQAAAYREGGPGPGCACPRTPPPRTARTSGPAGECTPSAHQPGVTAPGAGPNQDGPAYVLTVIRADNAGTALRSALGQGRRPAVPRRFVTAFVTALALSPTSRPPSRNGAAARPSESDNSKKRARTSGHTGKYGAVVGNGRLFRARAARQSSDMGLTCRFVGIPDEIVMGMPACRDAETLRAGHSGPLANARTHQYAEARNAPGRTARPVKKGRHPVTGSGPSTRQLHTVSSRTHRHLAANLVGGSRTPVPSRGPIRGQ